MIYQQLSQTEIQVSKLSLGCMSFHTQHKGREIVTAALDKGINFFDTADLYDKGENEIILGKVLKSKRQDVVIATKVGNRWRDDGSAWDWVPRKAYILEAVEASLKRLQTDYIDLYQLHGGTIDDPLEEVIEAFEQLQQEGKIRAYGISSIRPNTIRKWTALGQGHSCMTQYSMLDRRPEEATLDHLLKEQQGVLVRGALAKGLLAGKKAVAYLDHPVETVESVLQKMSKKNANDGGLAIRYVLGHPAVTTVVLGASSAEQLKSAVEAWEKQKMNTKELAAWRDQLPSHYYKAHR